jgi:hypothetical protein
MNSDDEGCEESVNLSAREDEEDESEAPAKTVKKQPQGRGQKAPPALEKKSQPVSKQTTQLFVK